MKFIDRMDLGVYMTFQPDKKKPIFNWMYYKEAFSSKIVSTFLKEFDITGPVLDPFVGVGTVPLECKYNGVMSIGRDANPLAVLISRVKCRNYDSEFCREVLDIANELCIQSNGTKENFKWTFELFPPERVFPNKNYEFMCNTRAKIGKINNDKIRDFLTVALISLIPQVSYVLKDGGVLKIMKHKHAADARKLFIKKVKCMIRDIEQYRVEYDEPDIDVCSARKINIPNNTVDCIITSPPYLNNVDYTKVYGLELSLAFPDFNVKSLRMNMLRSFLGRDIKVKVENDYVYDLLLKYLGPNPPLLAYVYFTDMYMVMSECERVLRENGVCVMIVGNSILERANIECDKILAEIAENLGMETEVWVGSIRYADVPVKGKQKVRESCIISRK